MHGLARMRTDRHIEHDPSVRMSTDRHIEHGPQP